MGSCGSTRPSEVLDSQRQKITMTDSSTLARISAYMDENIIKATLEAESQQRMAFEANKMKLLKHVRLVKVQFQMSRGLISFMMMHLWDSRKIY